MKVERYAPRVYTITLNNNFTTLAGTSSYNYNVKLPFIDNSKQYYIRCSRAFLQDIDGPNTETRCVVMRSDNLNLNNTFDTFKNGLSDILGVFELHHEGTAHFVAYNEQPNMHQFSGLLVNASVFQNNIFNINFKDLSGNPIPFTGTVYSKFIIELTLIEVD